MTRFRRCLIVLNIAALLCLCGCGGGSSFSNPRSLLPGGKSLRFGR